MVSRIQGSRRDGKKIICIECYPGTFENEIEEALLAAFPPAEIFRTRDCLKSPREIDLMLARELSDDPVFGRLSSLELIDFFNKAVFAQLTDAVRTAGAGVVIRDRCGTRNRCARFVGLCRSGAVGNSTAAKTRGNRQFCKRQSES